jgi:hypothetical protein
MPVKPTVDERLANLVKAGLVEWNGQRLQDFRPLVRVKGPRTVADLIVEDRG